MHISKKMAVMLALLASCTGSGCWAFYTTCPAEFIVTETESGKPLTHFPVAAVCIPESMFIGAPGTSGTTDRHGRVVLAVPDMENFPNMRFAAGGNEFHLDQELVHKGGVLSSTDGKPNISVRLVPRVKDPIWFLFRKHGVYGTVGVL